MQGQLRLHTALSCDIPAGKRWGWMRGTSRSLIKTTLFLRAGRKDIQIILELLAYLKFLRYREQRSVDAFVLEYFL